MDAKHISDAVAADDNGISASANPGNNAALTIGGALHSGNTVTNAGGRIVEITSAGDDAAIDATVTGTDVNGDALEETIDLADSGAAVTSGFFKTITKIQMIGNSAGNIIVLSITTLHRMSATTSILPWSHRRPRTVVYDILYCYYHLSLISL